MFCQHLTGGIPEGVPNTPRERQAFQALNDELCAHRHDSVTAILGLLKARADNTVGFKQFVLFLGISAEIHKEVSLPLAKPATHLGKSSRVGGMPPFGGGASAVEAESVISDTNPHVHVECKFLENLPESVGFDTQKNEVVHTPLYILAWSGEEGFHFQEACSEVCKHPISYRA
jgi:hypothetical protein